MGSCLGAETHPDGYIELKDRSKDIIISGVENISTIEVEDVLYRHPAYSKSRSSPAPTRCGAKPPAPL
jgi:fatty-acyl-CoA synthase